MSTIVSNTTSLQVLAPVSGDRPSWIESAPLMTWMQIPGTKLETVLYDPRGFSKQRALAQCGAAVRLANSEVYVMTGGHADGSSNSVYSIVLESEAPTWRMRNQPTPTELIQTNVSHYLDGRPTSTHTGWTIQYNQQRDLLMRFGVTSAYGSGAFNAPHVDAFNPQTNDWLPADTFPRCPITPNMDRCTAKVGEDIYQQSESGSALIVHWRNDGGTYGAWQTVGSGKVFGRGSALVHDPDRNRLVRFDRYRPTILPLDTPGAITPVVGPDYTGVLATQKNTVYPRIYVPPIGSAYDGKFLWIENGFTLYYETDRPQTMFVYATDPDTFENSIVPIAGTPPNLATGMTGILFGRFMVIEKLKILVAINRESQDIYFVRLV